ncbi:tetratricopeptide repeat protein [Parafilimonas sp.]|uniref:tetratricopeptide repeat-containing sensor histidine kinase n=1 Tax=Parafilimonas sp. TaxID=1969739 RepID=UPI0039E560FE
MRKTINFYNNWLLKALVLTAVSTISILQKTTAQYNPGLNKDSLHRITAVLPDDTSKVLHLILLGQQYENNIPDSAIFFYNQAKEISTKINYPAGIVRYINNYTAILNVQGKFDESLRLHQQAAALCRQYGLKDLYIKSLVNIGVVYQYKQDYEAAANHYLKNLHLLEETGDNQMLSFIYGNLCGVYLDLGQYSEAYAYAVKELTAAGKTNDTYTMASAYNNMANALKDLDEPEKAIAYLQKAYAAGNKLNDINTMETALINMGDLFNKIYMPAKAMKAFSEALPLTDSLDDVYGKSLVLHGIAYSFYLYKKYPEALSKAETALLFAQQYEQNETQKKLLLLLSDIKIATGDIKASDQFRNRYDSLNTAIANAGLLKDIKVMESKYEIEKKQSQILKQNLLLEQKDRQAAKQRTLLLASVAGIVFMLLLLLAGFRYYRQKQQLNKNEMQAMQTLQENIRLKSLIEGQLQERRRISQEMHDDISSGLTSMLFLSRSVQGQETITSKLKNLSQDLVQKMNEIIWTMNFDQDTLENLVAYMRKQIAETLDNAGIAYSFAVTDFLPPKTVSQEFRRNIYLAGKEAVHNIIKHAGATKVTITIEADELLHVIISDNGKGFSNTNIRFGNGVKNMRQRMQLLNGSIEIINNHGTTVILTAPMPL